MFRKIFFVVLALAMITLSAKATVEDTSKANIETLKTLMDKSQTHKVLDKITKGQHYMLVLEPQEEWISDALWIRKYSKEEKKAWYEYDLNTDGYVDVVIEAKKFNFAEAKEIDECYLDIAIVVFMDFTDQVPKEIGPLEDIMEMRSRETVITFAILFNLTVHVVDKDKIKILPDDYVTILPDDNEVGEEKAERRTQAQLQGWFKKDIERFIELLR